jgi:hypothetical protein
MEIERCRAYSRHRRTNLDPPSLGRFIPKLTGEYLAAEFLEQRFLSEASPKPRTAGTQGDALRRSPNVEARPIIVLRTSVEPASVTSSSERR